jgi:hypothetical protein
MIIFESDRGIQDRSTEMSITVPVTPSTRPVDRMVSKMEC